MFKEHMYSVCYKTKFWKSNNPKDSILSLVAVPEILRTRKHDKLTILNHNIMTNFLLIRKLN